MRKLLLHSYEIRKLMGKVSAKGYRIEWRYNSQGRAGHLGVIR